MPDITNPTLSISTGYENASPEEIEELITRPLEEAMSAVPGVEEVTSSSSEGSSSVRLNFSWGTDLDAAATDVRDRLDRVIPRLPDDADRPSISKFDLASFPDPYARRIKRPRPRPDAKHHRRPGQVPHRARPRRGVAGRLGRPRARDTRKPIPGQDEGARPLARPDHRPHQGRERQRSRRHGRPRQPPRHAPHARAVHEPRPIAKHDGCGARRAPLSA